MSYSVQRVVTWVIRSIILACVLSMTACTITGSGSGSLTKDPVETPVPRSIGP